jgi:hypothetical protein
MFEVCARDRRAARLAIISCEAVASYAPPRRQAARADRGPRVWSGYISVGQHVPFENRWRGQQPGS